MLHCFGAAVLLAHDARKGGPCCGSVAVFDTADLRGGLGSVRHTIRAASTLEEP